MVDKENVSSEDALAMLVASNEEQAVIECLETLEKLMKNIISKPMEEKFRNLKVSNPAIIKKIYSLEGSETLIKAMGYERVDEEMFKLPNKGFAKMAHTKH